MSNLDSSSYQDRLNYLLSRYEQSRLDGDTVYFDVEELEMIIDYYLDQQLIEEASGAIELGMAIHPENTFLKIRIAKVLLFKHLYKETLELLEGMVINDPCCYGIKADASLNLGMIEQSDELFKQYVNASDVSERADICYDIAILFINRELYENALYFIELGLQYAPDSIDLLQEYACIQEQMECYDKAIALYNRILDIDPYKHSTWFLLGALYYNMSNFKDALDAFEFAIAVDDNDLISILHKGHCLFNLSQYEDAIECYSKYLDANGEDSIVWAFLGECYENLQLFQDAFISYTQAMNLDMTNLDALIGRAICLMEQGDYPRALEAINLACTRSINNPEIMSCKGDILVNLADPDNNISYLVEALNLYVDSYSSDKSQTRLLVDIGNIYLRLEQFESAKEYYEKALEYEESVEVLPFLLAITYYNLKDYLLMLQYLNLAETYNENAKTDFINIYPDSINYI